MGRIRYYVALWAAKLSFVALKITRHNGTNFPGIVALKLCPDFIKYAAKPEKIIAVTGTNGKTTVSNLIVDMLDEDGKNVLNNRSGSNIATGIATSLAMGSTVFSKCRHKVGVFEVDEKSSRLVFPYVKPDYLLITNLSRDSIMRNGHPEYIGNILSKYIPKETKLVVNADDLLSCNLAPGNDRVYFGIEKMDGDVDKCINLINDLQICPKCHHKLEYEYLRYNHIGKAICPSCGYKSPDYDYSGKNVNIEEMSIEVSDRESAGKYRLLNDSVFNIYNVVSAVALMRELGYSHEELKKLFDKINIVGTRYDVEEVGDKKIIRLMAKDKNAFATSRVFDYLSGCEGDKEVIIMNSCKGDVEHWSENVCWLYDCDFEFLNRPEIKNITVCGPRGADQKLRLLMAGVPEDRITCAEEEINAPDKLKLFANDNIYVLYGTDSIVLGKNVAKKIKERIENEN